ncbi:MAG: ferritin-like domain-containing protein [Elusimicrobiota bacterium]
MSEKKEKLLSLLYSAFEKEYNDTFLYLREAELFRSKIAGGDRLGSVFSGFSAEELMHADRIASKIIELGGKAQWNFAPLETERSIHKVLEKHIENEAAAYMRYTEMLELCEDKNFLLILKGIRDEEKEHLEKAKHILKHLL